MSSKAKRKKRAAAARAAEEKQKGETGVKPDLQKPPPADFDQAQLTAGLTLSSGLRIAARPAGPVSAGGLTGTTANAEKGQQTAAWRVVGPRGGRSANAANARIAALGPARDTYVETLSSFSRPLLEDLLVWIDDIAYSINQELFGKRQLAAALNLQALEPRTDAEALRKWTKSRPENQPANRPVAKLSDRLLLSEIEEISQNGRAAKTAVA